jgi:predicted Ser/Thr protein kinase
LSGHTIIRYDNNLVVKPGYLRAHEAQTLQFIAAKTTIFVPKVYHIHYEDGKIIAIVIDYIPGKRLNEVWDTLNSYQKLSIANELHSYMN